MSAPGQTVGVSVFTDHLIAALALGRVQLSGAYACGTIISALCIARIGPLIDRAGCRVVATLSALGLGTTLLFMSRVDVLTQALSPQGRPVLRTAVALMTVTTGFFGLRFFGQGALTLASRTMPMKWFDRYRGFVSSVTGIFVMLMFSGSPIFFEMLIRRFSWQQAFLMLGGVVGVFATLVISIFFRDNPHACGLVPDGVRAATTTPLPQADAALDAALDAADARRTVAFWAFNLSTALFSLLATALAFHVVSLFASAGRSRAEAIAIFMPASVLAVMVALVAGVLCDTGPVRYRLKYVVMLQSAALFTTAMGITFIDQPWATLLIIGGNGVASGLFGILSTVSWPRYFGTQTIGTLTGINMSFLILFSAAGPLAFSLAQRFTGRYTVAALLCGCCALAIGVLAIWAKRPLPVRGEHPAGFSTRP